MAATGRLPSLDFVRGVAVLGILAVNIAGFAGPVTATLSPHALLPGSFADEAAHAFVFVVFEGKMRALFTLLFGAGIVLFVERMDAAGRDGDRLQLSRLGWLALAGLLHFYLLWWGDILFSYAVAGILALLFHRARPRRLLVVGLALFAAWHVQGMVRSIPDIAMAERVRDGTATPAEIARQAESDTEFADYTHADLAEVRMGFAAQAAARFVERTFWPAQMALVTLGETLPLILIGMAACRAGLFSGSWPRPRLMRLAAGGILSGGALTLALLAYAWPRGFPPATMLAILSYWAALPHLLMAAGYLAALVLLAPRMAGTWLGTRLSACGRMAFSNYIGTTVLMTAIFYGWGLGLVGTLGAAAQLPFVLLGWAAMLAWSKPWLACFRQGPLEWAWRSLVEKRRLPFRRA